MDQSTRPRIALTSAQYHALPKEERTILRRAAFGAKVPEHLTADYDLEHLHGMLCAENEATAVMPEKWTEQADEDEAAYFTGAVR